MSSLSALALGPLNFVRSVDEKFGFAKTLKKLFGRPKKVFGRPKKFLDVQKLFGRPKKFLDVQKIFWTSKKVFARG